MSVEPPKKARFPSLLKPLFKFGLKPLASSPPQVPELLLRSNFPPSDSERAAVCDVVAVVQEEIAQLQQKATFSQTKRLMLSRRTELLRVHNAVLSPIRLVPTEILENIFQHCTPQIISHHWRDLPWAISQVCRSWRDIALNLPYLWNRIPIHLEDNTLAKLEAQASFLTGILTRSRHAPLSLYVQAPYKEYDWHHLINALAPHSERIEELTIESSAITMNAFREFKGRLPLLRKLTLSKTPRPHNPTALIIYLFEEAPLLREVTLDVLYTQEIILPWCQLTYFNGTRINRTGLRQVVANCLDLERLEITGYSYGMGPKAVTLPRLTILKVMLDNPNITSNFFFGSLSLPVVEEIEVEHYQGELVPHLIPMLSRCPAPCTLRKLVLVSVTREAPGELTELLQLTPRLLELELKLPPFDDLARLIIVPGRCPLVPMLESLIIYVKDEDVWNKENSVTALARSRCEVDKALTDSFSPPSEKRRKLKTFRLTFLNPRLCRTAQVALNGWLENVPKPNADQIDHLRSWRHMLHEELPELDYKPYSRKRKFDLKFAHRLDRLLETIEQFQLDDVKALYASGLHLSLRRLGYMRAKHIPGENIHHFRMRSQKILNNWAPALRKNLAILQWVLEGTQSLIYVPLNDALRESSEALDMVYGLPCVETSGKKCRIGL